MSDVHIEDLEHAYGLALARIQKAESVAKDARLALYCLVKQAGGTAAINASTFVLVDRYDALETYTDPSSGNLVLRTTRFHVPQEVK